MLDEQLMVVLPLCKEATLIAKELHKPYFFKTKLQVKAIDARRRRTDLVVQVFFEDKHVYDWNGETMENRIYLMRDLLDKFVEDPASLASLTDDEDPFFDPVQTEKFIGSARILLESLTMQLETEVDSKILSTEGRPVGTLHCEIWPLSKAGATIIPDEEIVDDTQALVGQPMAFKLIVKNAVGLAEALNNNVHLEYRFYLDDEIYKIPCIDGKASFQYERIFHIDIVTQRLVDYFRDEAITFNLYGNSADAQKVAQVRKTNARGTLTPPSLPKVADACSTSHPCLSQDASVQANAAVSLRPQLAVVSGPKFEHAAVPMAVRSRFCALM